MRSLPRNDKNDILFKDIKYMMIYVIDIIKVQNI
jgi:hypothetical protein